MTVRLDTVYLGMTLANPLVVSASPLGRDVDTLHRLVEGGAAAVVLPSLFEEQIEWDTDQVHSVLERGADSHPEALSGYFPELRTYNTGPEEYLALIARATEELPVPVMASLNGASPGGWTEYARTLEGAGADALELNIYFVAADPDTTGRDIERRYLELVAAVRSVIEIPLAVKVGPYFSSTAHMARLLVDAGADGLVLFNRFYQPDIDLEHLEVVPRVELSTSTEVRLPLRWIAILAGRVQASLAATTGVHTSEDALKLLLAGADVTMMASALLRHGPARVTSVLDGIRSWLVENEYESVEQLKGSMSQIGVEDPAAFERANYMQGLVSYV